jgi:hypothetical protein
MKINLIIVLLITFYLNSNAQIKFENGYFITNEGVKVTCFIKNIDWLNNPQEFIYKINENSEPMKSDISKVSEFGILNISKYKRVDIEIDESSLEIDKLDYNSAPQFIKKQLFLKVLVEGKASLFSYNSKNNNRFFICTDTSKIEQLVYKQFMLTPDLISENNEFRNQLWNNLICSETELAIIKNIRYRERELINLFVKYNNCKNSLVSNFGKKVKKDVFNLTIRPGINISNLKVQNSFLTNKIADFGSKLNLRLGIEAEFILPFNKNKWACILEPVFQSYKSNSTVNNYTANVDFKSIEVSTGIRHYLFLNDKSKIFLNGTIIYNFPMKSSLKIISQPDLDISTKFSGALGVGYKYKNKYSLEAKYFLSRELLSDYIYWSSQYRTASLIFGYTLF